jgi:hypothetical protein
MEVWRECLPLYSWNLVLRSRMESKEGEREGGEIKS